jgi:hypothetical protein
MFAFPMNISLYEIMDIIGSPLVFSSEDICFDLELGVEAWFKN